MALLEAWRAGVCVLATAVVGNHDVVDHQRNGLLSACSDVQGGAAALAQLVADPHLRTILSKQAARDLAERFGRDLMGRRIASVHR